MKTNRKAFTLVELLVTITIIGIMAALSYGAFSMARESAKESATKATIAKLNTIIMQRYESYLTRRSGSLLPPSIEALPINDPTRVAFMANWAQPRNAAQKRLDAIRDLMRMEMPDARSDVANGPIAFTWGTVPEPALHRLYAANPPTGDHDGAQCLYLIVAKGSPEAMEQFHQNELGMVDGKPCFVDGWGQPIMFLRWAPGYSSCRDPDFVRATSIHYTGPSAIQLGVAEPYPRYNSDGTPMMTQARTRDGTLIFNPDGTPLMVQVFAEADHDPFDSRNVDGFAFHLIPLIYSGRGRKKADGEPQYGIDLQAGYVFAGNPYANMQLGQLMAGQGGEGNITNHSIEMR